MRLEIVGLLNLLMDRSRLTRCRACEQVERKKQATDQAAFHKGVARVQSMTASNLASSKIDNPMAAMLLARNLRLLAAQGNIKTSNSGRIFSGQNNPGTPNARQTCTTRHNPKTLIRYVPTKLRSIESRVRYFRGDYESTSKHFPDQAKIQHRRTFNPSNNFLSFNKLLSFQRFA